MVPSTSAAVILLQSAAAPFARADEAHNQSAGRKEAEATPYSQAFLPRGIRSRFANDVNGLRMHVLEAGFEVKDRPGVLLLHGLPRLRPRASDVQAHDQQHPMTVKSGNVFEIGGSILTLFGRSSQGSR